MTTEQQRRGRPQRWERVLGRTLDIAGALGVLLILSPLLLAVVVWVRLDSPGPALFRQRRVGLDRREFTAYKFRTMRNGAPDDAHRRLIEAELRGEDTRCDGSCKLADDPRITRSGAFLRRTSLDELPQLINVLRGEMALVGPRPITVPELERYGAARWHYLNTLPGMTGLWQVSGRNDLSYDERVRLDRSYAEQHGLALDLGILVRTVKVVLKRDGAR